MDRRNIDCGEGDNERGILLRRCSIDFNSLSFKELGGIITRIVGAKREMVRLAEQVGCPCQFNDDLYIELALFKPQTHLDMIKIAHAAERDYNNTLNIFASWAAEKEGYEIVEV